MTKGIERRLYENILARRFKNTIIREVFKGFNRERC